MLLCTETSPLNLRTRVLVKTVVKKKRQSFDDDRDGGNFSEKLLMAFDYGKLYRVRLNLSWYSIFISQ